MSKMTFKRIALTVVAALGFGVLASGPSQATVVANSDTLSLSATTATAAVGETATVSITATLIAGNIGDSLLVNVVNQSAPIGATTATKHGLYTTDSANAAIFTKAQSCTDGLGTATFATQQCGADAANVQKDYGPRGHVGGAAGDNYSTAIWGAVGSWQSGTKALSVTFAYRLLSIDAAGTYKFRAYLTQGHATAANGAYTVKSTPLDFTITVTANTSTTGSATYSKVYMNRTTEYTAISRGQESSQLAFTQLEADSALVVSAGTAASPTAHAVIYPYVNNSSDTKIAGVVTADGAANNTRVKDSVTVVINGPGLLAVSSYWGGTLGTRAKQVTMDWKESVVVYSDGTAGTGTITSYIGSSVNSAYVFSQAAKTIVFTGRATTFTASAGAAGVRAGSTILYSAATTATNGGDSVTAGTAVVRFLAKDAAGNAVTAATLSTGPGEAAFYAISSDTSVIASGSTAAARKSPALTCSYDADGTYVTAGYWYCSGNVYDSGTVTLTIVDSRTVTPNGSNYLTSTTSAVYKSDALSVTFAGAGYLGTMSLDKSSYTVGEAATLTSTCKDAVGRNVADGNSTATCFSNLNWTGAAPTFSYNASVNATGGTFGTGGTITSFIGYFAKATGGVSWLSGTDTALVYMPTLAGTYTLKGRTADATTDSTLLTFTVTDPVQDAQTAAIAAAQKAAVAAAEAATAAADAATDAALQAIDAANAATDAANLGAEAADAATVAAEEAKDAADAATAAVEALATQVATLMAALQAQVRSLANTVAKIAKKVKA